MATDGAPLCSKAGIEDRIPPEDLEDEYELLGNEAIDFFGIGTMDGWDEDDLVTYANYI